MGRGKPFVFFDLGGTIVDLKDSIRTLAKLVMERYSLPSARASELAGRWAIGLVQSVPRKESEPFATQFDVGARVLARELSAGEVSVDYEEAGRLLRTAWDEWQERARLCDGVTTEWLAEIRALAQRIGAVTDGDEDDVRRLLTKTGLRSYFDSVTTSEKVRAYKPNPKIYLAALSSLGTSADRSVFVSDSPLDLVGAAAVGMSCGLLRRDNVIDAPAIPRGAVLLHAPRELNEVLLRFAKTDRI